MLVASMLLAVLLASEVALAATIDCRGGVCVGTNSKDTLYGSPKVDVEFGLGGKDKLFGRAGNDDLYGGPGSDWWFIGGKGHDVIFGGAGAEEEMYGGRDADVLYDEDGSDFLSTKWEDRQPDKLSCGKGKDYSEADKNDFVSSSCEKKMTWGPAFRRRLATGPSSRTRGPAREGP
jgi:Ca2+-binding RTX toxin-like protein